MTYLRHPLDSNREKTKSGTPVDADFLTVPSDGTLAVDTTNKKLYFRAGGAWQEPSGSTAINVKDFGTDGVAIQAALNAAGSNSTVILEPGRIYTVDTQISVNGAQNLVIEGKGATLKLGSGGAVWGSSSSQRMLLTFRDAKSVTIRDLNFDGQGQTYWTAGGWTGLLGFDSTETNYWTPNRVTENILIDNCTFRNLRNLGLGVRAARGVTIRNSRFLNGYQTYPLIYGMASLISVEDLLIDNSIFDGGSHTVAGTTATASGMVGTLLFVSPGASDLTTPYLGGMNGVPTITDRQTWRFTAPAAASATPDATVSYTAFTVMGGPTPDMSTLDYFFLCEDSGAGANAGIVPSSSIVCTGIDTTAKTITVSRRNQLETPAAINWAGQKVYAYATDTSKFCRNVTIRDCRFAYSGIGAGLFLLGTKGFSVRGCKVTNIADVGLDTEWCLHGAFTGNTITNPGPIYGNTGIGMLNFIRKVAVVGNEIVGFNVSVNSYSNGAVNSDIRIADNNCETISVSGNVAMVYEHVTIEHNTVQGNLKPGTLASLGIVLASYDPLNKQGIIRNSKIHGNTVKGVAQRAVYYRGCDGLEITGNLFADTGMDAIIDYNDKPEYVSRRVLIEDNTLDNIGSRNRTFYALWASVAGVTDLPRFGNNHWRNTETALDLTQNWARPSQSTPVVPTGPRFLKVGNIWLRDNANILERSADSKNGQDGAWAAVAGAGGGGSSQLDLEMAALGYKAWTSPPWSWLASQGLSAGTLYLTVCYFPAGVLITGIALVVSTGQVGITLTRFGIYEGKNSTAALLASTGDVTASIGTVSAFKQIPLTTPWTVPADGLYYIGVLQVGTTPALMFGTGLPSGTDPQVTGKLIYAVGPSGLTDLPTTGGTWVSTNRAVGFAAY